MAEVCQVSVCIPVYNGERFLLECINSVLEQDFGKFELIIVDNCSTDGTKDLVQKISDHRIRYFKNNKNIGSLGNFNKCLDLARGKYFMLLPHDDLLLPGALRYFNKSLSNKKVGMVYSAVKIIDAEGAELFSKTGIGDYQISDMKQSIITFINYFVPVQLAMARTDVLRKVNGFEKKYGLYADIHMWFKVVFEGWMVAYNDKILVCHRAHADQGQQAFYTSNLQEVSKHWGKDLDANFWLYNSRDFLLLNLIEYVTNRALDLNLDHREIRKKFLKIFIAHHLSTIFMIIYFKKFFLIKFQIRLIAKAYGIFGLQSLIFSYPYIIMDKLVKKVKVLSKKSKK
ncbi:MAG: hypothetical protein CBC25_04345 [Pelagibacteraceae bacterium TMED65]|nr:MAG: hypothetical protein CBC25_04345 [Pelagibacteraceae bacterium TMED65]|tara:strand:- start:6813 stop:7838 length:1026 start_codon:yes stop_codon:yes gene_type:complete